MVSRCRLSTAIEIKSAISAVSLFPSSIARSVRGARLQVRLVLFIPVRNAGIQIPAYVIETGRAASERFDLSAGLFLDVQEPNHHVRNLHAGVVDVVLNVHFPARKAQQADKCVAENGVAQVPDVRRLVGIDAGMLDQHFAGGNIARSGTSSAASAVANSARLTRTLMYPPPATSNFSKPGIAPTPATISSAILRGALRSFFASSKAIGSAYSPNSIFGGCSTTMLAISRP